MAEAFGIVSGAVSLTSIFSSSLECFRYVQLGRHFERDYQQSLVTLNLLETRLSRWGEAAGIYEIEPRVPKVAEDVVFQILRLFSESERKSKKFNFSRSTPAYSTDNIGDPNYAALVNTTSSITSKRKKGPGMGRLVSWVVYDRANLRELIEGISQLMDQLEQLFPNKEAQERLVEQDISELVKAVELEVVQKVSDGVDELLGRKARQAISQRSGHAYGKISVREDAQASNGNVYLGSQASEVFRAPSVFHVYEKIHVSGRAKVHNGDWFGGRPF